MIEEEIRKIAKDKYPKGTKYKDLCTKDILTINTLNWKWYSQNILECNDDLGHLYDNGKFAEVVSYPKGYLIQEQTFFW